MNPQKTNATNGIHKWRVRMEGGPPGIHYNDGTHWYQYGQLMNLLVV